MPQVCELGGCVCGAIVVVVVVVYSEHSSCPGPSLLLLYIWGSDSTPFVFPHSSLSLHSFPLGREFRFSKWGKGKGEGGGKEGEGGGGRMRGRGFLVCILNRLALVQAYHLTLKLLC